jgi:hypothetical protein
MFDGFKLDVIQRDKAGMLVKTGTKVFGPASQPLNKWISRPKGAVMRPPMNGWRVYEGIPSLDKVSADAISYIISKGNDVQNQAMVCLTTGPNQNGHGWSITPGNFVQSMVVFTARKLPKATWLNNRDEFNQPDETHPEYDQFTLDGLIWALFNGANQTSSLPPVEYKGETHEINNEFFWLTPADFSAIPKLPRPLFNRARKARVPFVAQLLEENAGKFSEDAQAVLDIGRELVVVSAAHRTNALAKYHLNERWDAGWYQIRMGLYGRDVPFQPTDEMIDARDRFATAYSALTDRLRPLVYDLGFLPQEDVVEPD